MMRVTVALTFCFFLASTLATKATAAGINEEEAHAIGVDAYLYFYPLLSMDLTRRQSTNIEPGKEVGKGPMNAFSSFPAFPAAGMFGERFFIPKEKWAIQDGAGGSVAFLSLRHHSAALHR
jgi:hypothetical protein